MVYLCQMSKKIKNQRNILDKLKIAQLNAMQQEAQLAIHAHNEVMVLSPTGTGKTLAFLLPVIAELDPTIEEVQALIIVPARELAIQIEQVIREMGTGYKTNAVYGGRSGSKDKLQLKHRPAILVGTPGRLAYHLRKRTFSTEKITTLVLDEFDKSLEIGFAEEMKEIVMCLEHIQKKILTSATQNNTIPDFLALSDPLVVDHLDQKIDALQLKSILSPEKDKLKTLVDALSHLGEQRGIVFCNFKNAIQRISDFLRQNQIPHGCFYGGLDQKDREGALVKFRNGTHRLIIATDLAARGIDVPELDFILHYHLPPRAEEFIHRNGRTARMHQKGTAYVLHWEQEDLPDFIGDLDQEIIGEAERPPLPEWTTLFISGGRKDKISKGDIAGLFFKQGQLKAGELGVIELKNDCAFVAVHRSKAVKVVRRVDNSRLKKKKVRVRID